MNNKFDTICFDVDSTLVACEGLDWLAEQKGLGSEVKKITEQAMNGEVKMENSFAKKIDLIKPSKKELELLGEYYCSKLVESASDVVFNLKQAGLDIWLVTGSLQPAIFCLAERLQIPLNHVFSNEVYHNSYGDYQGIDQGSPLTKSSGKASCVQKIGKDKKIAFIGDSVTDLATKPVVSSFIGYGGVTVRSTVKENAEFFIKTRSMEPLLWLVLD